jgi:hypothetical protein
MFPLYGALVEFGILIGLIVSSSIWTVNGDLNASARSGRSLGGGFCRPREMEVRPPRELELLKGNDPVGHSV